MAAGQDRVSKPPGFIADLPLVYVLCGDVIWEMEPTKRYRFESSNFPKEYGTEDSCFQTFIIPAGAGSYMNCESDSYLADASSLTWRQSSFDEEKVLTGYIADYLDTVDEPRLENETVSFIFDAGGETSRPGYCCDITITVE
jgi:hypothetical protein